jgi:hypothetical protein
LLCDLKAEDKRNKISADKQVIYLLRQTFQKPIKESKILIFVFRP